MDNVIQNQYINNWSYLSHCFANSSSGLDFIPATREKEICQAATERLLIGIPNEMGTFVLPGHYVSDLISHICSIKTKKKNKTQNYMYVL